MSCPPNTTGPTVVWATQEQSGNLADSIGAFEPTLVETFDGPMTDDQVRDLLKKRGWTVNW